MLIFRKDPCGILTVLLAYAALAFADYVVVVWLVLEDPCLGGSLWGTVHAVIFNLIFLQCFLSHLRAMITDPGVIPRPPLHDRLSIRRLKESEASSDARRKELERESSHGPSRTLGLTTSPERSSVGVEVADPAENLFDQSGVFLGTYPRSRTSQSGPDPNAETVCRRCDMYRPPRAHHCRICQGCIRKMDHHCPWINNCVGAYNQKYFLQFLVWVGVASIYAASLTVYSWVRACTDCDQPEHLKQNTLMWLFGCRMYTVILMVECCLFGIFVCVMLFDQLSSILKDETGIESLSHAGPYRPQSRPTDLLREVCGHGWKVFWVCPCQNLTGVPSRSEGDYQDTRRVSGGFIVNPQNAEVV